MLISPAGAERVGKQRADLVARQFSNPAQRKARGRIGARFVGSALVPR